MGGVEGHELNSGISLKKLEPVTIFLEVKGPLEVSLNVGSNGNSKGGYYVVISFNNEH